MEIGLNMATKKHLNKEGFTLAELLMAVLVISIIMVALAPVITKRVMDNVKVNIFKNDGELFLYSTTNPTCTPATDGQKSVDCIFTPPQGVNKVSAVIVSGGGGGAGAASPALTYDMTETAGSSTTATSQTKTINITDTMKEVVITYMTGGGGGGSAGAYSETEDGIMSQADCDKYNAMFVEAKYNGSSGKNTCVTKYNVGDSGGPAINTSVATVVDIDKGETCTNGNCCWKGTTANPSNCTTSATGNNGTISYYSGCNRTLCGWDAAQASCAAWHIEDTVAGDWRLPTTNELYGWGKNVSNISSFLGTKGLQLCDSSTSSKGNALCASRAGYCYFTNYYGACNPSNIFIDQRERAFGISNNSSGGHYYVPAASARCVLERTRPTYKPYAGGGGGGAPYIKNYAIPEDILNANIGGRIEVTAGAGGKGSEPTTSAGADSEAGEAGGVSSILLYDYDNRLKWGLRVYGGNGAKRTMLYETGYGSSEGADSVPLKSCQLYNGSNWTDINCTGAGTAGYRGETAEEAGEDPKGGNGGDSLYAGNTGNGGMGGTGTNTEGTNGTTWGAGGGGGSVYTTYDPDTGAPVANKGKGGNGGNGIVQINYGESLQVAGGGAGGGGAFARIVDLEVVPGQEYAIRVGGGGTGGSANNPGQNGGQSWVKIGATTYSLDGGEGGKVGTAQTQTAAVVHGLGGSGSFVQSSVADASEDYYDGDDGTAGDSVVDDLTGRVIGSSGGCGGESGIGSIGSTGGMNICTEGATINGINATPLTFLSPGNVFNQSVYGTAGAGGGGGGWDRREGHYINLGNGSSGLDGYVYVFWTDHD